MKLYGAIDLHSTNNVTVVINEQDQVVYQKRLPNDLSLIVQQLSGYQTSLEGIVVESTYNWYWLVDGLMEKGHRLHLANTAAIQQYNGLKYTDDHSDARWLAHLLRLGILPEGYIYPKQERMVRDLLRKRGQLVHQRTANLLSIQSLISRTTGNSISAQYNKYLAWAFVEAANFAIRFNSRIKSFYQKKKSKSHAIRRSARPIEITIRG
jgi:transposase